MPSPPPSPLLQYGNCRRGHLRNMLRRFPRKKNPGQHTTSPFTKKPSPTTITSKKSYPPTFQRRRTYTVHKIYCDLWVYLFVYFYFYLCLCFFLCWLAS